MESQIPRQHGHDGDEQLPNFGLPPVLQGEDERHRDHDHHEKKFALKNVKDKAKAKAKKIKETLTKHGHGHEHDDHHSHDDDDDDDEDDELIEEPEVHGAPMYESSAVRSGVGAGRELGVNLEKPTINTEDRYDTILEPPTTPFSQWEHEKTGQGQFGNIERARDENEGNPGVKIGNPTEMEEDPNAPKDRQQPSNYQSKIADPTGEGGKEAGITPILHSLDKMSIYDEPHPQSKPDDPPKMFMGSHDQFLPEPIPENVPVDPKDPGSAIKAFSSGEKQSGYGEISSAASALTEKALAAKNIVSSKLGYSEKEGSGSTNTSGEEQSGGVAATVADYGYRAVATVAETLAPVTEKVANVGSSVLSKVQGNSTGQPGDDKGPSKGMKEYLSEKLRPSEEDKVLSEVISDALHRKKPEAEDMRTGKVTVSDEVASRLGTREEDPKIERDVCDVRVGRNANPTVVEKLKGWFGIGTSQSSQCSTNDGNDQFSSSTDAGGERTLQESSN